jgi:hypothetical protein
LVDEKAKRAGTLKTPENIWWARQDSNLQPDRYERAEVMWGSPFVNYPRGGADGGAVPESPYNPGK